MKKLLTALFVLGSLSLSAQTLFYYGKDSVSAQDFLNAYKKNNTGAASEQSIREYLDLYIASRLKIREAKDLGLDTMPQFLNDQHNLRIQLLPSYINNNESINQLVEEAFERAQKNIRLSHIFIRHTPDPSIAEKRKQEVIQALKTEKFSEVAKKFSDDPSVKMNGGDLGWVAVFTLPYELENIVYSTPVGKHSEVYTSKAGYHIFRNEAERNDPGRLKAAQILLAFPPDADETVKKEIKQRADSIYERLKKGDDFAKLAGLFSNDVVSAAANGQMQEFGAGQYDAAFEQAAFALNKDGALSSPFQTAYGYHIVKRLSWTPARKTPDEKWMASLRERVEQSDRISIVKKQLAENIRKERGYQLMAQVSSRDLFAYTDSVMLGRFTGQPNPVTEQTPLIQIGKDPYRTRDWINFVQTNRYRTDGSVYAHEELWPRFVDAMSLKFYEDHLEEFNPLFRQQLAEFGEGNLFFEIMQMKIWGPSQNDSLALEKYYRQHASRYVWKQSADAILFFVTDPSVGEAFRKELVKKPMEWRSLVFNFNNSIAADSSRIELSQVPNPTKMTLKPRVVTQLMVNPSDNSASFALILKMYNKTEPRSFEHARGLVINDYQQELEKKWMEALKKKYPVRVNEEVLRKTARN